MAAKIPRRQLILEALAAELQQLDQGAHGGSFRDLAGLAVDVDLHTVGNVLKQWIVRGRILH